LPPILAFTILLAVPVSALGQAASNSDALVIIVNLERIRVQLLLADKSLTAGDAENAFAHAFIPHAATFPSVKAHLKSLDERAATELESHLTELPIMIRTSGLSSEVLRQEIAETLAVLDSMSARLDPQLASDKSIVSQTAVFLLRDAIQSYELSSNGVNTVDHENAAQLVDAADSRYQLISGSLDERRRSEIASFFTEL
jgi:high-affinity iron transporter